MRHYGSGSFKKRKGTNSYTGYVYGMGGHKVYGSGSTREEAERNALLKIDLAPSEPEPLEEPEIKMPTLDEWTKNYNDVRAVNNRLKSIQKYSEFRRKVIDHCGLPPGE